MVLAVCKVIEGSIEVTVLISAAWTNSSGEVIIQGQTGSGTGDDKKRGSH